MSPFMLTILRLFAKPVGAAINNAITAGAGAVTAYAVQKGADVGVVTPIVSSIVTAVSLTISALASTQGVNISVINADTTNGVRVVDADKARDAGIPKIENDKTAAVNQPDAKDTNS